MESIKSKNPKSFQKHFLKEFTIILFIRLENHSPPSPSTIEISFIRRKNGGECKSRISRWDNFALIALVHVVYARCPYKYSAPPALFPPRIPRAIRIPLGGSSSTTKGSLTNAAPLFAWKRCDSPSTEHVRTPSHEWKWKKGAWVYAVQFRSIYRAHTEGSIGRSTSILYAGYHVQVSFTANLLMGIRLISFFFFFALYLEDSLSRFYSCFFFFFNRIRKICSVRNNFFAN